MNFIESREDYLKRQASLDSLNDLLISYIEQSDARIKVLEDLLGIKESPNLIEVLGEKIPYMEGVCDAVNSILKIKYQFTEEETCEPISDTLDKIQSSVDSLESALKMDESPNAIEQLNYEVEYLSKHITDED
jgi:hypothetical protein